MFTTNQARHKKALVLLFLGSICFLLLTSMEITQVSATDIFGPRVYTKYDIGAPGEDFKVGLNVTNAGEAVSSVLLYYAVVSIDEAKPANLSDFSAVPMLLEAGDVYTGFWTYQFPGQANSTEVYLFVSILNSKGGEMNSMASVEYALPYRIFTKNPTFQILFLGIDKIDVKTLTADISFSTHIVSPYDSEYVSLLVDSNGNQTEVRVPQMSSRYEYSGQFKLTGLALAGDPTTVPFDKYRLDLNFFTWIKCKPEVIFEAIWISNYNDRATWSNSWTIAEEEGVSLSQIHVSNEIQRRIESAYFFVIPAAVCFFLLGGSHLMSSKKHLGYRLTIYLTIFVFLLGSFSVNQIIQGMVPNIAYGITAAELTLAWLAGYLGIYLFFSLLGFTVGDSKRNGIKLSLLLDSVAFIIVLIMFFVVPVARIESPFQAEIHSLYAQITDSLFKGVIVFGMGYGIVIKIFETAYWRGKQRELLHKGMDY